MVRYIILVENIIALPIVTAQISSVQKIEILDLKNPLQTLFEEMMTLD